MTTIEFFKKMLSKEHLHLNRLDPKNPKHTKQRGDILRRIDFVKDAINALELREFFIEQNIKDSKGLVEKAKKRKESKNV